MMRRSWLIYAALGLLILGPLLLPGYVLTLDLPWPPSLPWPPQLDNTWLYRVVLHVANLLIPSQIIEKLILLTAFVVAGVGVHRVTERHIDQPAGWARIAPYLAGVLYVVNPFTYERFVTGQYLVLAGYALLPWFVTALATWLDRPGWRRAWPVVAWGLGISLVSIHSVGFAVLLAVVAIAVWWPGRQGSWRRAIGIQVLAMGAAGLLLSSYWLIPWTRSGGGAAIGSFDTAQYQAYATNGGSALGVLGQVLSLRGFWGERHSLFLQPTGTLVGTGFLALVVLIVIGGWQVAKRRSRLGITLMATAGCATILAGGVALWPGLTRWLVHYVPLYQGYREPQKFVALIALAWSVLVGVGAVAVIRWLKPRLAAAIPTVAVVCLALPLVYAPDLILAAHGQLRAANYPAAWYSVRAQLAGPGGRVVVLPWHEYLTLPFAGRTVANPASRFFGPRIISSDDPELGYTTGTTSLSDRVAQSALTGAAGRTDLARRLRPFGATKLIWLKDTDQADYGWLEHQTGLKLVTDSASIAVYNIEEVK